ncbi:DEAD/DEAH box helicase [Enterobacter roggenkampii]|uniref:DEAD/DEAH box helicase n=1 Tax=Enterobacter roggenkampii TaxID=1812935 RepID=UPI003D6EAF74
MLNFDKIGVGNVVNTSYSPREIFQALPKKDNANFQYPRDVQSEVWTKWQGSRDSTNTIIKMNTGGGKTVVGLIILKSCLNEKKGPAVYLVPDNYLVQQVINEANKLGISVTTDETSVGFLAGNDILVANIYKLVNGKSRFGVGSEGIKIPIGSIIIDDAHACLNTVESQFTARIIKREKGDLYHQLLSIFSHDMANQNYVKYREILNDDYAALQEISFWAWQQKIEEVTQLLVQHNKCEDLLFSLPLIKEKLSLCKCVISAKSIEITPHIVPIDIFPSLENAYRKIYMTATLADDSILSTHFGVEPNEVKNCITPERAGDIGERLIILPQVLNPKIYDKDIKEICQKISSRHNVVVICPSEYRAKEWADISHQILKGENLNDGIHKLKTSHVGLTVLINRYDGIDLPKDACRLLVVDGLPNDGNNIEKIKNGILLGSKEGSIRTIQRIEQGMGRGVRSNDDYCVVMLLGPQLANLLYVNDAKNYFSPATKSQIELSEQIAQQLTSPSPDEIIQVMDYCLSRNEQWIAASKGVLSKLTYQQPLNENNFNNMLFKAFSLASRNSYPAACRIIEDYCNSCSDKKLKGYAKQILAEYTNFYDPSESQKILKSANELNQRLLKPIQGIQFNKIDQELQVQPLKLNNYVQERYNSSNNLLIHLNSILDDLQFKPSSSNRFEAAIYEIGKLIGYESERPEEKYKEGPDNLWAINKGEYLVIECKNEATNETISKYYCNQLNGSGIWFKNNYDHFSKMTPILIHPSINIESAASLEPNSRIMDAEKLSYFKSNIQSFFNALVANNELGNIDAIRQKLAFFKLQSTDLVEQYTKPFNQR